MKKKFIFYVAYFIGIVLFLEIVLRIFFPIPELENFNRINYQILDRKDDQTGYLRNINMLWKSYLDTNYDFVHELNHYGFRDPKDWKIEKSNKKRFFFVGDSFVEGMMSTSEETIPIGFETAANNSKLDLEWFNCGMMGIGLNEYIKFIKDAVPIYKPDELVLVLYSNDAPFQRKYIPEKVIVPQKSSFWELRIQKLINHIKADDPIPFIMAPEKRPFYLGVPDASNPWTKNEANMSRDVTPTIAEAMKKGDFNYFRANWIMEEQKFLKIDINLREKFEFIKKYLEQFDCGLTICYIPSRSQVTNYYFQFDRQSCLQRCPDFVDLTGQEFQKHARTIAKDCKSLGIPFKDFTPLIQQKEAEGKHLYWNYDDHMRGKSYLMLGNEIYKFWSATKKE